MERADVVVIGSGYGGAITAARLAEAGLRVLVLERGPWLERRDLRQSDDPKYIQRLTDLVVSSENAVFRTGNILGGASVTMDGAHFRVPRKSFGAHDAEGRRYWPDLYGPETLAPYFDRAEAMLRIRQFPWEEIPKAGGLFGMMLDRAGASCERARMNYADCLHCGFCSQGCTFGKKMDMLHTYLPRALDHGAMVRPSAQADRVVPEGTGYTVHYRRGGLAQRAWGQRVIVAGGGIHSPALLLRSANDLPHLSPHVGENFNNNGEHGFVGILPPDFEDLGRYACYRGMENAGLMSFHFFEEEGFTLHPGAGLEPSIFAAAFAAADHPVLPARAWGMDYKRFVEAVYPHRVIAFSTLGLADGHRAVALNDDGTATLVPRDRTANDAYLDRLEDVVFDIGRRTGVTLVPTTSRKLAGTTSAHLLCACRMAESADHGVVDADCQVFGYENLYVCDASVIPYALGTNPALTISALAERTAERILAKG